MELVTQNGKLDLPQDFSLHMERTNPLLSGEGDASVPATLPSSSRNLAALGHRERIDRADRYINKVDAILQVGPVQKRGQLVVDTLHRHDGIDASFAIDSSDLYVRAKDKSLKAIFEEADKKETFASVTSAKNRMWSVFGGDDTYDYAIFPVAIAKYETESNGTKTEHYQYNNEVLGTGNGAALVWEARTVHEGDVIMSVPAGYGIAPFLKLHALLRTLFECLDYTVTSNCFTVGAYADIVVVHNCSDCLCNPTSTLFYKDLVPSCKLSEFLEWLLAKFHAQPIVDSETKTAKIVLMEDVISSDPDSDFTEAVVGDWKVQLNPTKRIVLTPSNDIEGTEPAAETFDKLVAKYGNFVEVDEPGFWSLTGANPVVSDCLVLRKSIGRFYSLNRNIYSGNQTCESIGTNHFTYDRDNSADTEAFSQADVMPLMLCSLVKEGQTADVVPYIGDRLHAHTSYEDKEEKDEQKIIVVRKSTNAKYYYKTTGTTQHFIPYQDTQENDTGDEIEFDLTNYGLYKPFWKGYNQLLRNHATHFSGNLLLTLGAYLGMDMSRTKLCNGQHLLPVAASSSLADKMSLVEAEFLLVKSFADGVSDEEITPGAGNGLKWSVTNDAEDIARELFQQHQEEYEGNSPGNPLEASATYTGYSFALAGTANINPGMPTTPGETRTITALATITVEYGITYEDHQGGEPPAPTSGSASYSGRTVTFTFTAVNA